MLATGWLATRAQTGDHGTVLVALHVVRPLPAAGLPVTVLATSVPRGPAYSLVLVAHMLAAVVGFGTVGLTGWHAGRAAQGPLAPGAPAVRRYFRSPTNWAPRAVYAVPVLGFALVGLSHGAFRPDDGFVVTGLVLWAGAVAVAEMVVWPAERRLVGVVAGDWGAADLVAVTAVCRRIELGASVLVVLFVAATVVMVVQP